MMARPAAPKRLKKAKPAASAAPDPTDGTLGEHLAAAPSAAKCYMVRYWAHDEALLGRDPELVLSAEFTPLATVVKPGDRIFLQAWEGGALTGRARLCIVTDTRVSISEIDLFLAVATRREDRIKLQQTWAWSQGASVETLKALSWVPEALELPVYSPKHEFVLPFKPVEVITQPSFYGLTLQTTTTAEEKPLPEIMPTKDGFKKLCDKLEDADLVKVRCERRIPR